MDFITHWLKSREPEVVGLQKVKVSDADFPHATSGLSANYAVVHGEKGWNGVAVLSRMQAEADTRGLPGRRGRRGAPAPRAGGRPRLGGSSPGNRHAA